MSLFYLFIICCDGTSCSYIAPRSLICKVNHRLQNTMDSGLASRRKRQSLKKFFPTTSPNHIQEPPGMTKQGMSKCRTLKILHFPRQSQKPLWAQSVANPIRRWTLNVRCSTFIFYLYNSPSPPHSFPQPATAEFLLCFSPHQAHRRNPDPF